MQEALDDLRTSLTGARYVVNEMAARTAAALASASVRRLHEVHSCGLVVLLLGYFEAFLKDACRSCARVIEKSGRRFSDLPERVRLRHYEHGGRVLAQVCSDARQKKPGVWGATEPEDVVRRLGSGMSGGASFELVWEAFAETRSNPNSGAIAAILKSFGVAKPWRALAGAVTRDGWDATRMKIALDAFVYKRNDCAHTGATNPSPSATDIEGYIELVEVLGETVAAVLQAHASALTSRAGGPGADPDEAAQ